MTSRHALESAYCEFGPRVLRYLRSRIRDSHDCEELLQEVFVICARDWDGMNAARSKQAWMIGIARNLVREYLRRRKTPNTEALLDLVQDRAMQADADDELSAMRMAITGLPATFREVIELRLADELSYAEIAEGLGIPVGTVRSRLHHAVKLLKEAIVQYAEGAKRGAH